MLQAVNVDTSSQWHKTLLSTLSLAACFDQLRKESNDLQACEHTH
jgi:hypothetical protein